MRPTSSAVEGVVDLIDNNLRGEYMYGKDGVPGQEAGHFGNLSVRDGDLLVLANGCVVNWYGSDAMISTLYMSALSSLCTDLFSTNCLCWNIRDRLSCCVFKCLFLKGLRLLLSFFSVLKLASNCLTALLIASIHCLPSSAVLEHRSRLSSLQMTWRG